MAVRLRCCSVIRSLIHLFGGDLRSPTFDSRWCSHSTTTDLIPGDFTLLLLRSTVPFTCCCGPIPLLHSPIHTNVVTPLRFISFPVARDFTRFRYLPLFVYRVTVRGSFRLRFLPAGYTVPVYLPFCHTPLPFAPFRCAGYVGCSHLHTGHIWSHVHTSPHDVPHTHTPRFYARLARTHAATLRKLLPLLRTGPTTDALPTRYYIYFPHYTPPPLHVSPLHVYTATPHTTTHLSPRFWFRFTVTFDWIVGPRYAFALPFW